MSRRFFGMVVAVLLLGTFGGSLEAQEWTRFRGPNGSGVSDARTIPSVWKDGDINWKIKLPSAGHCSPVVWGDKIFLIGADDATALRSVICVSAANGEILWQRSYPSRVHRRHKLNSFASATPAVDKDYVYVTWSAPEELSLIALDHQGEEVWYRNLGPFVSQHSGGASPILFDNLVILQNDQDVEGGGVSFWIAVDRTTGKTVWKTDRPSVLVPYSTPCVYQPKDGGPAELIFNSSRGGIAGVEPLTGKVKWEVPDLIDKRSVSSPVILDNGLISISCGSGGGGNFLVLAQPPSAGEPKSGKMVYKFDRQAPYVPTPLAKGNLLFMWSDKGFVSCIKGDTGETAWQQRVGGDFFGSPICVDDKLFCASSAGEMVVISATETFEELGRNDLGEMCHSSPAVSGGRLYIRTLEHLLSVGGEKKK